MSNNLVYIPDYLRDIIIDETIFHHEDQQKRFELFIEQGLSDKQENLVWGYICNQIDETNILYGRGTCSIAEAEKYIEKEFNFNTSKYQITPYDYWGWTDSSIRIINGRRYIGMKPIPLV
jgi:hypothetical protein